MKKIIYLLINLSLIFTSCDTEEPIPTYTLSTSVSPTEGGTISISPKSSSYKQGDMVTLTVEPNEHWVFQKWDGDVSGNSNPLQITMNSNKSVVGVFIKRDYPLSVTIVGQGTVDEKIVPNPSGREYPHGTTVELTPKPKEGWMFESWEGDLTGNESPKKITVDKEKKITVKFKRIDYQLNIIIEGEGTVEEKIVTNPSGKLYPYQTVVELTPKPKDGWIFVSWGGDLTGNEKTKNITVDKEKNVNVKFVLNPNFKLHPNGITCICTDSKPGEKGIINGEIYESVDNALLKKRRDEGANMSRLCTSLVTEMSNLFKGTANVINKFNQPIDNWDVSNVTNMAAMFSYSTFNQPIGSWDVSKVTDLSAMFQNSEFNQPLENWNVSNVLRTIGMFNTSKFNQPIGNWDVSKVVDMSIMFQNSLFNQPIGNWNVVNVNSMGGMFALSQFNQPIGNWNVRNVVIMNTMFRSSKFNQDISKWCVSRFTSQPALFSDLSPLTAENLPKWGTCPN